MDQVWGRHESIDFAEFVTIFASWVIEIERVTRSPDEVPRLCLQPSNSMAEFQSSIQRALKQKKEEDEQNGIKMSFERILLKFDQMHAEIKSLREAFDEFASPDGTLGRPRMVEAIKKVHQDISIENVDKIFLFTDVDTSRAIDFKEFIAALTVSLTLHQFPPEKAEQLDTRYHSLKEMLGLITSAYLLFDTEGKGYIERAVVDSMIQEHTPQEHVSAGTNQIHTLTQKMLSETRWSEMVCFPCRSTLPLILLV